MNFIELAKRSTLAFDTALNRATRVTLNEMSINDPEYNNRFGEIFDKVYEETCEEVMLLKRKKREE